MSPSTPLQAGDRRTIERTFTVEEVETFARLSGDTGEQHTRADAEGRRMVHGLLLASMPTKLGGTMNFLARDFTFEFLRPVYTGEIVRCEVVVTSAEPVPRGIRLESAWECVRTSTGEVVMRGRASGLVPQRGPGHASAP